MENNPSKYLFHISEDTWQKVCNMYFRMSSNSLRNYLQLYPFSEMTLKDKKYISSHEFYTQYIQYGSITMFNSVMQVTDNYLLKKDGSFRNSTLLSPILFLILQAVGKEISLRYINTREKDILAFYSGNYDFMNAKYGKEYSKFYHECKLYSEKYKYFIKTDISSFFSNVNTDKLVEKIDKSCNPDKMIQLNQLEIYKDFLEYCGKGIFPLVENSMASSYLATIIYLNKSDNKLYDYIRNKINISDFKMIRYVDDLYIFSDDIKKKNFYKIRNQYSSYLKEDGLAINNEKTGIHNSDELEKEIKTSFYGEDQFEIMDESKIDGETIKNCFIDFLDCLNDTLKSQLLDYEEYKNIINKTFFIENSDLVPDELFNKIIYDKELNSGDNSLYKDSEIQERLSQLVQFDDFLWIDPKRLTIMLLNTRAYNLIVPIVHSLKDKSFDDWSFYDVVVAITYLTHRRSNIKDLYSGIAYKSTSLFEYIDFDYFRNFRSLISSVATNNLINATGSDWIIYYLYFEARIEFSKNNTLTSYAFFKNYFDRMTATIEFFFGIIPNQGKKKNKKRKLKAPSYNLYYRGQDLGKVYKKISEEDEKIAKDATDIRNDNPVSHASSGLLNDFDSQDINRMGYHTDAKTIELVNMMGSMNEILNHLYNYESENQKREKMSKMSF